LLVIIYLFGKYICQKKSCKSHKKANCLAPCKWIVGKGCNESNVQTPPPKSNVIKPKSCKSSRRKTDCDARTECKWIVGKGCNDKTEEPKQSQKKSASQKKERKSEKMTSKFRNEITWNGYNSDVMKSGIQKYIRRGILEKALYCAGELDLFKEDTAADRGEVIRTNFLLIITKNGYVSFQPCEKPNIWG